MQALYRTFAALGWTFNTKYRQQWIPRHRKSLESENQTSTTIPCTHNLFVLIDHITVQDSSHFTPALAIDSQPGMSLWTVIWIPAFCNVLFELALCLRLSIAKKWEARLASHDWVKCPFEIKQPNQSIFTIYFIDV